MDAQQQYRQVFKQLSPEEQKRTTAALNAVRLFHSLDPAGDNSKRGEMLFYGLGTPLLKQYLKQSSNIGSHPAVELIDGGGNRKNKKNRRASKRNKTVSHRKTARNQKHGGFRSTKSVRKRAKKKVGHSNVGKKKSKYSATRRSFNPKLGKLAQKGGQSVHAGRGRGRKNMTVRRGRKRGGGGSQFVSILSFLMSLAITLYAVNDIYTLAEEKTGDVTTVVRLIQNITNIINDRQQSLGSSSTMPLLSYMSDSFYTVHTISKLLYITENSPFENEVIGHLGNEVAADTVTDYPVIKFISDKSELLRPERDGDDDQPSNDSTTVRLVNLLLKNPDPHFKQMLRRCIFPYFENAPQNFMTGLKKLHNNIEANEAVKNNAEAINSAFMDGQEIVENISLFLGVSPEKSKQFGQYVFTALSDFTHNAADAIETSSFAVDVGLQMTMNPNDYFNNVKELFYYHMVNKPLSDMNREWKAFKIRVVGKFLWLFLAMKWMRESGADTLSLMSSYLKSIAQKLERIGNKSFHSHFGEHFEEIGYDNNVQNVPVFTG